MKTFTCPSCQQPIDSEDANANTVRCKNCDTSIDLRAIQETHVADVQTSRAAEASPPQYLGHYRLVKVLGQGSFGAVWKARDERLDRTVAIKVPRAGRFSSSQLDDFLNEARAVAKLNHPGIVRVHEVGQSTTVPYIVTELIRGSDLKEFLKTKTLSARRAAQLSLKLAEAMGHAHDAGVVHRDLKPANVMMDEKNRPHVMDFGLAKQFIGRDVERTIDGQIMGTPAYMSPEQARGDSKHVDQRSDVYSLGVMLFEFLTGELPFRGRSAMLLRQVLEEEPPLPQKLNASIPIDLQSICLKCLEKEPDQRYESAQSYAEDLLAFLNDQPIRAKPSTRWQRFNKWCRRNPVVASISSLAFSFLVAMLILSVVFLFRERRLRLSIDEALVEKTEALANTEALTLDLQRKRSGLDAAMDLATGAQNELKTRMLSYAQQLYAYRLHEAQQAAGDGRWYQARQGLDLIAKEDPDDQFRCWAWSTLDQSLQQRCAWLGGGKKHTKRLTVDFETRQVCLLAYGRIHRYKRVDNDLVEMTSAVSANTTVLDFDHHPGSDVFVLADEGGGVRLTRSVDESQLLPASSSLQDIAKVRISPDASRFVVTSNDQQCAIFDTKSLGKLSRWRCERGRVDDLCWHPTGESVALLTSGKVEHRSASSGELLKTIETRESFRCMCWNRDGSRLLVGGWWNAWSADLKSGQLDQFADQTSGTRTIFAGSSVDQAYTVSSTGQISLWDVSKRRLIHTRTLVDGATIQLCVDGRSGALVCTSDSGEIAWTDPEQESLLEPLVLKHEAAVRRIDWHPDSNRLAAADWQGRCVVWDVDQRSRTLDFYVCKGHYCEAAMWNPAGDRLATSGKDGSIQIWDAKDGSRLMKMSGHQGPAYGVAWHPDGRVFASCGVDEHVRFWNVDSPDEKEAWKVGGVIEEVAWDRDGKHIFSAGHRLAIRDAASGKTLSNTSAPNMFFNVAPHPSDERFAACNTSGQIHIKSMAPDFKDVVVQCSGTELRGLAWSPDGRCLVCTDWLGNVWLRAPYAQPYLMRLRGEDDRFDSRVWDAKFSPDGKRLAVCDEKGRIFVWNRP